MPGIEPPSSNSHEFSRRTFVASAVGAGAAAALGPSAVASAAAVTEQPFAAKGVLTFSKPNILFILADDLGYADLSSFGSLLIRTPNLDALAAGGLRFTHGYSASSTCSPTRIGLYTGRYPGRTAAGLAEPIVSLQDGLDPKHPTLASLVRGAGYSTAMLGKWHCGQLPYYSPTKSGWEEFFGNFTAALDYFSKTGFDGKPDLYKVSISEEPVAFTDLGYYTDVLTDAAVQYVRDRGAAPTKRWLLNLNYTTPHWPWMSDTDRAESDRMAGLIKDGMPASRALQNTGSAATYKKMVEGLDRSIGEVLKALEDSGQSSNTLVVFTSDNGGERYTNPSPFTGGKFSLHEGGIRVPTILRWPRYINPNQVTDEPVFTLDWTATLVAAAGARPDPSYPFDGKNLLGYLLKGYTVNRTVTDKEAWLFWRTRKERALRDNGPLKYYRDSEGQEHLYNLDDDPAESVDLSNAQPGDLTRLREKWLGIDKTLKPYT